ncbi:MAG: rhodanese-like domain-containing protein [Pirellulales bacterium]
MSRFVIAGTAIFLLILVLQPVMAWQAGKELEHTKDSLDTVKKRVESKEAVLVDVRDLAEWQKGVVDGAVLLNWRDLQDKFSEKEVAEKLPKDKIVYTYCAVGYRALKGGKVLAKYGYDVRPLKPGYDELIKHGFKSGKP